MRIPERKTIFIYLVENNIEFEQKKILVDSNIFISLIHHQM